MQHAKPRMRALIERATALIGSLPRAESLKARVAELEAFIRRNRGQR